MTILIACDSFKDALSAKAVCQSIERGLLMADPSLKTRIFPLADGGEGTFEILRFHMGLLKKTVTVHDPLFRKVSASYGLSPDGQTAFIEMAEAAGLQLLTQAERNPLKTSTYGVGELILAAIKEGATKITLAIGGSATNDGGIGMAAALGYQFLDNDGRKLEPIGGNLGKIQRILANDLATDFSKITVAVICDVKNPLLGEQGAAKVYARQKGATNAMIRTLENGMTHFSKIITAQTSPLGAGAAGGLGFGAQVFLNAVLKRGIDRVLDLTDFDSALQKTDLVITGEGQLDSQTAQGKLIDGICQRARRHGVPVIALCGAVDVPPLHSNGVLSDEQSFGQYLDDFGLKAAFSIAHKPTTLSEALAATAENLEKTAFSVGRLLR